MSYDIALADVLAWAATYDGPLFHALLCDPPYHLTSITERFGGANSAPAQHGKDGSFGRLSKGFMGKNWDGGDLAFRPETWAAFGKLLHPGAFGMAFASTRGFHRMAVAIEDAGFIIHPTIFCWAFGSGFPKATRLDTQIDRAAGADPVVVGTKKQTGAKFKLTEQIMDNGGFNRGDRDDYDLTAPATDLARAWVGHRYGLQALKPALEPIIVFQKPYQGRPVDCITRTGAGALNIDGARIGMAPGDQKGEFGVHKPDLWGQETTNGVYGGAFSRAAADNSTGRWPANLTLSHHPACNGTCVEACPVRRLGEQSGESEATRSVRVDRNTRPGYDGGWEPLAIERGHDDTGTAARFFYNADWMAERLEAADPLAYYAKASTAEREAGLDGYMSETDAEIVYGEMHTVRRCPEHGDSARGNYYTCGCALVYGRKAFEESTINDGRPTPIDNPYQRGETKRRNIHPTVKPIALARHLATLLLPPDLYAPRRLFIPFAGVASEMIGAIFAGWDDVRGVELDAAHVEIAHARLAYWQQRAWELSDPDTDITVKAAPVAPNGQLTLFD